MERCNIVVMTYPKGYLHYVDVMEFWKSYERHMGTGLNVQVPNLQQQPGRHFCMRMTSAIHTPEQAQAVFGLTPDLARILWQYFLHWHVRLDPDGRYYLMIERPDNNQ